MLWQDTASTVEMSRVCQFVLTVAGGVIHCFTYHKIKTKRACDFMQDIPFLALIVLTTAYNNT